MVKKRSDKFEDVRYQIQKYNIINEQLIKIYKWVGSALAAVALTWGAKLFSTYQTVYHNAEAIQIEDDINNYQEHELSVLIDVILNHSKGITPKGISILQDLQEERMAKYMNASLQHPPHQNT